MVCVWGGGGLVTALKRNVLFLRQRVLLFGACAFFLFFFFLVENICLQFHTNTMYCDYIHLP